MRRSILLILGRFGTYIHRTLALILRLFYSLASLKRLFRIVLDATNTAFALEDIQWRSSVAFIFAAYLSALWQDPQVCYYHLLH